MFPEAGTPRSAWATAGYLLWPGTRTTPPVPRSTTRPTNTWVLTGSLNVPGNYPTATLLNTGQVLVVGGQNPNTGAAIGSADLFNPSTGSWSLTGSLKT